jgi:hypothetical protein
MKPRCCPYCNQVLPEVRQGVSLSGLKARIYDVILRSGETGITRQDLAAIAFDDRETSLSNVSMHVLQLNELLAGTDYKIAGRGYYRLVRTDVE